MQMEEQMLFAEDDNDTEQEIADAAEEIKKLRNINKKLRRKYREAN